MNKETTDIIIIGAGISGMATAAFLRQHGKKPIVLEKNYEPGGVMKTIIDGEYVFDMGSNSSIEKNFSIQRLISYLGIEDQKIEAKREASKRYILKNDQLHPIAGPKDALTTSLISAKAKWKALGEFRRKPKTTSDDESLASFVRRRLGSEILDYIVNPVIAGIYAGDPNTISMKANFPEMAELEQKYGSVLKGMIKKRKQQKKDNPSAATEPKPSKNIYSFKQGMQFLPKTIAAQMSDDIRFGAEITNISKTENQTYLVSYIQQGKDKQIEANQVVSTAPAYSAAEYLKNLDAELSKHLSRIYYPPVIVMNLVYDQNQFDEKRKLDSFGFLIPEKEGKSYLGAIWSSVFFQNRAPEGKHSFTVMIGGSRMPALLEQDYHRVMHQAQLEFEFIMKITGRPLKKRHIIWSKAIPQYQMNYTDFYAEAQRFEAQNGGFYISGNYRGGFSTADCIENAEKIAEKIANAN